MTRFVQVRALGFAAAVATLLMGSTAPAQTILQATIGEQNQKTAEVSTAEVRRILADGSAILLDTRKRAARRTDATPRRRVRVRVDID